MTGTDLTCEYCGADCAVEVGYCHCGCGAATKLRRGHRGQPWQYLKGHQLRTLTAEQVRQMRAAYLAGGVTQRDLAQLYHMSVGNINHILMGDTYADVR